MTASVTHGARCSAPNAGSSEARTRRASASSGGGFWAIRNGSSGATSTLTGGPPGIGELERLHRVGLGTEAED